MKPSRVRLVVSVPSGRCYREAAAGREEHVALTNLTDNVDLSEFGPAWSPNGRRVAFGGFRSGDQELIGIDGRGYGGSRKG